MIRLSDLLYNVKINVAGSRILDNDVANMAHFKLLAKHTTDKENWLLFIFGEHYGNNCMVACPKCGRVMTERNFNDERVKGEELCYYCEHPNQIE